MRRTPSQLRDDALAIWQAGVDAVKPQKLLPEQIAFGDEVMAIGDTELSLRGVERIVVVGAGKAAAGMVLGLEQAFGGERLRRWNVSGSVIVPDDCIIPTEAIQLRGGRPGGVNEPRAEGVAATKEIISLLESLGPGDICLALISGGGSALMVAPAAGISLADKIAVAQRMSAAGADIWQLNRVRRALSAVKGGGLARACRAARLEAIVISDILGDPLELIASGPAYVDFEVAPEQQPLAILADLSLIDDPDLAHVVAWLRAKQEREDLRQVRASVTTKVRHHLVATNATAVDAAGVVAERLGYSHAMVAARRAEGTAEEVGRHLAKMACQMVDQAGPDCIISGGEPTVQLADATVRGKGGRNQQLVLAAAEALLAGRPDFWQRIAILSGGTDGEDGPTDAAGASIDQQILAEITARQLSVQTHLQRNDAYPLFAAVDGLLKTGPTHTNVCDLRVVCVDQSHHH